MKTQTDKVQDQQNAATLKIQQEPGTGGTAIIVDNRPSTLYQRKLRETMNAYAAGKTNPVQRKAPKGSSRFRQIAMAMGENHGVDTSGLVATHNSSFPAKLNAEATIQGNKIHFAPGMDTDYNIRHEVGHAIDNSLNGIPKGDRVVNGQKIDTTREKVVDSMAKAPITHRKRKANINEGTGLEKETNPMGKAASRTAQLTMVNHQAYKPGSQEPQVIQREVGFEFEVKDHVKTYKSGRKGTYKFLNKKDKIVRGTDFYVEADEITNGATSWEFVTVPFPETKQGLIRLIKACSDMENIAENIRQSPDRTYNPVDNNLVNPYGMPVPDRYFYKDLGGAPLIMKPQVTAGFSLSALDRLYHSASTLPGTAGTSDLIRDVNDYKHYKKNTETRSVDIPLGKMRSAADKAIVNAGLNVGPGVDELRGLVTHLIQVIIGGKNPILGSPKTVMRLALARTDMAAVYGSLPSAVKVQFAADPAQFANLVMLAATYYNGLYLSVDEPVMSNRLFTEKT
ncbi:MAG: hypothetical protein KDD04_01430, partial [Sinomicrobium sp.]|nr:hypothetical protein [Sinomicrobium sp.]